MVTSGLVRINGGADHLLVHPWAEIERGMAAARADGGAAERHETISQRMASESDGNVEALTPKPRNKRQDRTHLAEANRLNDRGTALEGDLGTGRGDEGDLGARMPFTNRPQTRRRGQRAA